MFSSQARLPVPMPGILRTDRLSMNDLKQTAHNIQIHQQATAKIKFCDAKLSQDGRRGGRKHVLAVGLVDVRTDLHERVGSRA